MPEDERIYEYKGDVIEVSIYGESHSERIGAMITNLPEDVIADEAKLAKFMRRRAPGNYPWSTPRKEADEVVFAKIPQGMGMISGYIKNTNTKPGDYAGYFVTPRPSHADYTARIKYGENSATTGGGAFSGRMTAPLCIAGGIAIQELEKRGIYVRSHIKAINGLSDVSYYDDAQDFDKRLQEVERKEFPTVSDAAGEAMKLEIGRAKEENDSVGGTIETVIYGMPGGIGGPLFEGLEGKIAQIIFAIPAVKGIGFGNGFGATELNGSTNNDSFGIDASGEVMLKSNRCGGILGGISLGLSSAPIVFETAFKPTPSIACAQTTVNLDLKKEEEIKVKGRHDPCIVPRAVPVTEAAAAIAIWDALLRDEFKK